MDCNCTPPHPLIRKNRFITINLENRQVSSQKENKSPNHQNDQASTGEDFRCQLKDKLYQGPNQAKDKKSQENGEYLFNHIDLLSNEFCHF